MSPTRRSEPLRVGLVTGQLSRGGAERQLYETAVHLDHSRFVPVVYCTSEVTEPYGPMLEAAGVAVRTMPRQGHAEINRVLRLARMLRQDRIELVHSFLFHANAYTVMAARLARVRPAIVSIRNCEPNRPRWERVFGRCIHALADRVVANSEAVRDYVVNTFGTPARRIAVVYNGVDLSRFLNTVANIQINQELGLPQGARVVVTAGRLEPQKRVDRFLRMAQQICAAAEDVRFVVAGDGTLREQLQALAQELGIASRVHFVGPRNDIPEILARSSVFVLTSDYEGLPNVVIEAMAAGKPVVTTQGALCRELLQPCNGGIETSSDTPQALAESVLRLLADPAEAQAMGRRGRAYVEREFTVEKMVERVQGLYEDIFHQRFRPRNPTGDDSSR